VEVLINPAAELCSSEPCARREVFHWGGIGWGDVKIYHIYS
jgi:hypothetical protein